jgi:hypothetical protein
VRALALVALVSTLAGAEPLFVSVNFTTSGRWLEATPAWAAKKSVKLEGSDLTLGGTIELMKRLGIARFGGQLGVDAMLWPEDLTVLRAAPLRTAEASDDSVSSMLFFTLSPYAGLGTTGTGPLAGWVDLLVSLEVLTARVEGERHFAFTAAPTLRLGFAFQADDFAVELSLLGSFFGAQRLTFAMGFRL